VKYDMIFTIVVSMVNFQDGLELSQKMNWNWDFFFFFG